MILILLSLIVGATSQANCSNETAEGRIGCIASNIQSIVNISVRINDNIIVFAIIVSYRMHCMKSSLTLSQVFLKNLNEIFDL